MSSKLRLAHQLEKKWRSDDVRLQEQADFSVLLLSDPIMRGLSKAGFKIPSPIQMESIPVGRSGKDLLVQAKSGTGKTLVFTIIALEMFKPKLFHPQILIIAPTREIATQIHSVIQVVGSAFRKLTCRCFIGGLSVDEDKAVSYNCQIAVGTPGRVRQLIRLGCLPTKSIRLFILDEADQLLHGMFKMEIDDIFGTLPENKQMIVTSATYPARLKKIFFQYLKDPYIACLNSSDLALIGIIHYTTVVRSSLMPPMEYKNKLAALEQILTKIKFCQCLVFCNVVVRVDILCKNIKQWGFSASSISSLKEQTDRLKVMDRFKHFKSKVLVSSDLSSRGIDAENVDLIVNFDLANTTETYLHRSGRAGRYGSVGLAVSIITEKQIMFWQKIEMEGGFKSYKLPEPIPKDLIDNPLLGEYTIKEANKPEGGVSNSENEDSSTTNIAIVGKLISNNNASNKNISEMTFLKHHTGNSTEESMCGESHFENNAEISSIKHQPENSNEVSICDKSNFENIAKDSFVKNQLENDYEVIFIKEIDTCCKDPDLLNVQSNIEDVDEYDTEAVKTNDNCKIASAKENCSSSDNIVLVGNVKNQSVPHVENKVWSTNENISIQSVNTNPRSLVEGICSAEEDSNIKKFGVIKDVSTYFQKSLQNIKNEKSNRAEDDSDMKISEIIDHQKDLQELNDEKEVHSSKNKDFDRNGEPETVCVGESNELKVCIENSIHIYESAHANNLHSFLKNNSEYSSDCVVSADKIKTLHSKAADFFYNVLKEYENKIGDNTEIEDRKQVEISDKLEENTKQNTSDETNPNIKVDVSKITPELSFQSEITIIDDSSNLKDVHKPDFESSNEAPVLLKTQIKKLSDVSQPDSSDSSTKGIHSISKPKLQSTPSLKPKSVFETLSSSEYSDFSFGSELDEVSESSTSSSSSESSHSDSDSDSSCITSNAAENNLKRNAKISYNTREILKKHCASTANSSQKYHEHSNRFHQFKNSKTLQQKLSDNYSSREKFCNQPKRDLVNTCTVCKSQCNTKHQHRNPSIQKKVASSGYSGRGRFPFSHRSGTSHSCVGYGMQYNTTIPCGFHFAENSCNYCVPSNQRQPSYFNRNSCYSNQPQTNYWKQSCDQCSYAENSKCPCKHTVPMPREACKLHCTKSAANCRVSSSCNELNNDLQTCTKSSSNITPWNCARNNVSSVVCPGYHSQSHSASCYGYSHSNAACSLVNFQDIFYNQWRFLQRCVNPYL